MTPVTAIGAHLWQSTLFAAAVGVATLLLRKNRAAIRHALWLAASVKFLVPFAALTAIGVQLAPRLPVAVTESEIVLVMSGADAPLPPLPRLAGSAVAPRGASPSPRILGTIWLGGAALVLAVWWIRWRRVAAIARAAIAVDSGREVDALRNLEREAGVQTRIRLVETAASLEPGVFGFARPVLIWPRAIGDHLDDAQILAILAHEVAHVRRRDNVTAALHMVVQALFWFHPLVWWLGARLVDERERACDEAVVSLGNERRVYAETILKACRAFVESPLACVSGVTGSDLRKRIERIMSAPAEALTAWKKTLVAAIPLIAVVTPIVVGVLDAPRLRASSARIRAYQSATAKTDRLPQFEVASVKPTKAVIGKVGIQTAPNGRFTAENVTLRQLIRFAYQLQDSQLSGGPKWLDDDHFDIVAKADGALGEPYLAEQSGQTSRGQLMLRALLADRFKLQAHNESREQAIYALVAARRDGALGPHLQRSTADCSVDADARRPASPPGARPLCGLRILPGNIAAGGAGMAQLANTLAMLVSRIVFDRTGLTGSFDFTLTWTPDQIPTGFDKKAGALGLPPVDPNGPSIFTALQEQLGLKLDSQRGPVDVLVVDRAERPTEN